MNSLHFPTTGGFKFETENFEFFQNGIIEAFDAMAKAFYQSNNIDFIISGCEAQYDQPNNKIIIAPGMAMVSGEVCFLNQHEITSFDHNFILDSEVLQSSSSTTFDDNVPLNEHRRKNAFWQADSPSADQRPPEELTAWFNNSPRMLDKVKEVTNDTVWQQLQPSANITNGSAAYQSGVLAICKTARQEVKLAGSCIMPASYNGTLFVLPEGFRPAKRMFLNAVNDNVNKVFLQIETDGQVSMPSNQNNAVNVVLDGLSFDTVVQ